MDTPTTCPLHIHSHAHPPNVHTTHPTTTTTTYTHTQTHYIRACMHTNPHPPEPTPTRTHTHTYPHPHNPPPSLTHTRMHINSNLPHTHTRKCTCTQALSTWDTGCRCHQQLDYVFVAVLRVVCTPKRRGSFHPGVGNDASIPWIVSICYTHVYVMACSCVRSTEHCVWFCVCDCV